MNNTEKNPPPIGENLTAERKRRQMTISQLALVSGISKAMLSQIEADKVNPTVATLWKIAKALDVNLETLISGDKRRMRQFDVFRKDSLPTLVMDDGSVFHVLSTESMTDDLEMYRVELPAGVTHRSQPHASETREFLNCLSGKIRVSAGDRETVMDTGDFMIVQADTEHSIENLSEKSAELFMVVRFR